MKYSQALFTGLYMKMSSNSLLSTTPRVSQPLNTSSNINEWVLPNFYKSLNPSNLSYWWGNDLLANYSLVILMVTSIFLAVHHKLLLLNLSFINL